MSSEQYPVPIGPSVSLEKLNMAHVLSVTDIPIGVKSRVFLYGDSSVGPPAFDFLDLAPSEIAKFSHIDLSELVREHQEYIKTHPDVTLEAYIQKKNAHRERLYAGGYTPDRVSQLLVAESETPEGKELTTQFDQIFRLLSSILRIDVNTFTTTGRLADAQVLTGLLTTLRENPEKPFLVIYGHGGPYIDSSGELKWSIGEATTNQSVLLSHLFAYIKKRGSKKYAAIILVSCNEYGLMPPDLDGTLVVYVDGLAGQEVKERKAASRT